jgi:hypothetical protein
VTFLTMARPDGGLKRHRSGLRGRVRGVALLASVAAIGLGLAAQGGAAAATQHHPARSHLAQVGTHYAVYKRLCRAPTVGHAACMAIARHPASKTTPNAHPYAVRAAFEVGPAGGLTPGDIGTAYGYNPAVGGADQTVAIIDAYDDPTILADLDFFDTHYGLPLETATSFVKVGQAGSPIDLPAPDRTGWSQEESLDVEAVRGVCNLCRIVLIEADSPSNVNLAAAVETAVHTFHATEISNSYGGPEFRSAPKSVRKQIEAPYKHKGVVITAATGDDGWYSWDRLNDGGKSAEAPNAPASFPSVVAVGGTQLALNANGTRRSERVWNENGRADASALLVGASRGATGGGCSVLYRAQGWQLNANGYAKTGCGTRRLAADVSVDGDPESGYDVYDTYNCSGRCPSPPSHWQTIGGTSLSAPLVAAMWALAGGSGGVDFPALSLYGHAQSASPPLYDVKKGGNSWCNHDAKCATHTAAEIRGVENPNALYLKRGTVAVGTVDCGFKRHTAKPKKIAANHQCNAAKGYDGPSGVGTPKGLSVFTAMSPRATFAHGKLLAKHKASFTGGGRDPFPGGKLVKFRWSWGDGRFSGGSRPTHVYAQAGQFSVRLKVTDNYGRTAITTGTINVAA